jgi:hypothetical protein
MSCKKEKTLDDWAMVAIGGILSGLGHSGGINLDIDNLACGCFDIAEAMQKESRKRREEQEQRNTINTGEL